MQYLKTTANENGYADLNDVLETAQQQAHTELDDEAEREEKKERHKNFTLLEKRPFWKILKPISSTSSTEYLDLPPARTGQPVTTPRELEPHEPIITQGEETFIEEFKDPNMSNATKAGIGLAAIAATAGIGKWAKGRYDRNRSPIIVPEPEVESDPQTRVIEDLLNTNEEFVSDIERARIAAALNKISFDNRLPIATRDKAHDLAQQVGNGGSINNQDVRQMLTGAQ